MTDLTPSSTPSSTRARFERELWARRTSYAVLALVLLCLVWETVGAPIKPLSAGFPWLALKGFLLLPLLPRLWRGERRAFQILTLLILLYATEGWVRAFSDVQPISRAFAWVEIGLSTVIFIAANLYARRTRVTALSNDTTPTKARRARPGGRAQLIMYVYATLLCLAGMSYLYQPDGSESPRFFQIVTAVRVAFLLMNAGLIAYWLQQGHARAQAARNTLTTHSDSDHESERP